MRTYLLFCLLVFCSKHLHSQTGSSKEMNFFAADHPAIQYTGRIDFSDPLLPRFWQPGVYFAIQFTGPSCEVIVKDEVLWGKNHNYLEVVVDGVAKRIQTRSAQDTILVASGLAEGAHSLLVVKNTEANIGYLELVGIRCNSLLEPLPKPERKMEFIGNSITCGTGSDMAGVPCGKGEWHDQHNAYMSYASLTARALQAQYHLSAVSGIGLMRSCCNMDIIMPAVFDKVSMRNNEIVWDFNRYQPAVVSICLGQNDGVQDSALFCDNYIAFIRQLRSHYPDAVFVCLTSPMGDSALTAFMKKTLSTVVERVKSTGDQKIAAYFFSRSYTSGCDYHPDLNEQQLIAEELTGFIKQLMKW
jgi:hypothetical protein